MTWKEFKALVDSELVKQDVDENIEIWFIDIAGCEDVTVNVEFRGKSYELTAVSS